MREQLMQLKNTRVLAVCGVMAALAVALKFVASIDIGNYIRVGFSNLPMVVVGTFFGPVIGGIFGGVMDVIKYIVAPNGPFFPGFTLTAAVSGAIYGAFLYKRSAAFLRVFAANLAVKIIANLFFNTLWLNILYGQVISEILPARILSNAVMLPIDTLIMYLLLRAVVPLKRVIFSAEA